MDTIGERLREERLRNGWSQKDLARESKINVDTISGIETGQHEPRPSTLTKLAKALSIEVRVLFEEPALAGKAEAPATGRPKVQASLWPEEKPERRNPEPSDAQRRLAKVDEVAAKYLLSRVEKHDAEVRDPNSPHFSNATAATLWLAGVEDERAAWLDWASTDLMEIRAPAGEGFDAAVASAAHWFFDVLGPVLGVHMVTQSAKGRIEAMNDTPDELAARRLEAATAAVEASRKRLEDPREAASG